MKQRAQANHVEEPGAVIPHAGICAGAVGQLAVLPRWLERIQADAFKNRREGVRALIVLVTCLVQVASAVAESGAGDILVMAPDLAYETSGGGTANDLSKFQSLGVEEKARVVVVPKGQYDFSVERLGKFSGILMIIGSGGGNAGSSVRDSWFPYLRRYVQNGGKIFFSILPLMVSHNEALMEAFNVAVASELVYGTDKKGGQASLAAFSLGSLFGGTIGSVDSMEGGPYIATYFRCGGSAETKSLPSRTSGKERVIACKITLGKGQVWFFSDFTSTGGGWGSVPYSAIFYDRIIDLHDNETMARAVIRWLSR